MASSIRPGSVSTPPYPAWRLCSSSRSSAPSSSPARSRIGCPRSTNRCSRVNRSTMPASYSRLPLWSRRGTTAAWRRSHARKVSGVSPLSSAAALTGNMGRNVQQKYKSILYIQLTRQPRNWRCPPQQATSMNRQTSPAAPVRTLVLALALGLTTPLAFAGQPEGDRAGPTRAQGDIVDTAVAAGQFKTLAAALGAAGLIDTLKGNGPFTVFAPTDAAFAALPAGTVDNLLKPE